MAKYDAITQAAITHLVKANCIARSDSGKTLQAAIESKHPGAIERARKRAKDAAWDRKFTGSVPQWAKTLVLKHGYGNVGTVTVRQSRTKDYSSGHCWYGSGAITVTLSKAGSPVEEQKATVLHEIAHTIAKFDRHGDVFYDKWYEMLRVENLYRYVLTCGRFVGVTSLRAAARRSRAKRPLTKAS